MSKTISGGSSFQRTNHFVLDHRCFMTSIAGQEFFLLWWALTSKKQKVLFFICLPFFTSCSKLDTVKSIEKFMSQRFQPYIILIIQNFHRLLAVCTVYLIFSVFTSRQAISHQEMLHLTYFFHSVSQNCQAHWTPVAPF